MYVDVVVESETVKMHKTCYSTYALYVYIQSTQLVFNACASRVLFTL